MSFGKQMRLRREELQLSRASLAEMLGVSPSAISNYENGVSSPKEEVLLRLFDASEAMIAIGIPAFRITSFTYPLAAVSIVASSVFQALGKSMYSMLVSLGRQLIVLIPVAYLFSLTGVLDDVWLAFPIAEVVCLISSLFFLKKVLHRLDDFPQ